MRARDVMTTEVVTVRPETPIKQIATLMVSRRISGIPVVEVAGRLVGMVTDGDIYRRAELGTQKRHQGWLESLTSDTVEPADYVEAHGHVARDVMTTEVFAVTPNTSLAQIADLFETRRIRRVPVVENGAVIGIVSRANLVQALASAQPRRSDAGLEDGQMRDLVLAEYKRLPWGAPPEGNVIVVDGIVHLWGFVPSEVELAALRVAADTVPGVKGFADHTIRFMGDAGTRPRNPSKVTIIGPDENEASPGVSRLGS